MADGKPFESLVENHFAAGRVFQRIQGRMLQPSLAVRDFPHPQRHLKTVNLAEYVKCSRRRISNKSQKFKYPQLTIRCAQDGLGWISTPMVMGENREVIFG
jgi:hypothetical protein